ncbi:MAG: hypothetical protein NVSMB3_12350 [Acidobacteriaceae bacterium]
MRDEVFAEPLTDAFPVFRNFPAIAGEGATVSSPAVEHASAELLREAQRFAERVGARPAGAGIAAPLADLKEMGTLGLLSAPLPLAHGGFGLGSEPGNHLALLRLLSIIGGIDLVLGRLFEGHVNALLLIAAYGSPAQVEQAARDAHEGLLFGVWNTGSPEPLLLEANAEGGYRYRGGKTFASGAAFVQRPIVTAQMDDRGWQMTLPRMESPQIANHLVVDRSFWRPLGMEASESYAIDLTGASIEQKDLIGEPGVYYRDPFFRGGAIRFAAVHAGAILQMYRLFTDWLRQGERGKDPYQIARLGEIALAANDAVLWVERAAAAAEYGFTAEPDKLASEQMIECANMTRLAIERLATSTMQTVISGVGAHGLLQAHRFERIIRNLTMYLRQPSPDQTLADIGRSSLRKADLRADGVVSGLWSQEGVRGTMPPRYFEAIYSRSVDPWDFETSAYEAAKYAHTLASLPRAVYSNALEIGCSIGVLTQQIAPRCEALMSVDVSERALEIARQRCAHLPEVRFRRMEIPAEMPEGRFDLVVLSEVVYYWQREDLERAATLLAERQGPGGHLILVHYTPPVPDYPLTGDQVHEAWLARPEWRLLRGERRERYRLDVLERTE